MKIYRQLIARVLLSAVLLISGTASVQAQEIRFTAEINTDQVNLGSAVQLTLTINGVTNIGDVNLPELENFDVQYLGPSTHVSIVNGKYYSSKSFTYSLLPQKTGRFIIQPFNITINGQKYSTEPMELLVLDADQPLDAANAQSSLKDKINLVLRVPKREVYINEALPVKVMLLVSNLSLRDIRFPQLNSIGFMVGDFEQPKQYQQIINGIRYDIVEFDTVVYPTRSGELSLGPAQMESNMVVSSQQSLGNIFNDAFFNSFFDRQEKRPLTLRSDPVTINVKELPSAGKPDDFTGAVGNYDFDVSVSPTDVRVGDPITLRMGIRGRGNLKAIELPEFADTDQFKIYKPNVKEDTNAKTLEQVIIPLKDDVSEVPAIRFSFFDPQLEKYQTITKGPFPLDVEPLQEGETLNVVGLDEAPTSPSPEEKLGEDIVFIKNNLGALRPAAASPVGLAPVLILLLGLAGWAAGLVHFKWTHRLATDQAFARRLRAPAQARKDLQRAKALLAGGAEREFYDAIFKSFQNYLTHKFQLPPGQVSAERVKTALDGNHRHEQAIRSIEDVFAECESVRYASRGISREEMLQSFHRIEKLIDYLERHVK